MRNDQGGFTLIETLVAMTVLTIGIFALYSMQVAAMRGNHVANVISQASNYNAMNLEQILVRKFDGKQLEDRNGNSKVTNAKMAMGLDERENKTKMFGLNDGANLNPMAPLSECKEVADFCEDTKDGLYRIVYNVAVDYPVIGVKTIRMHVRSKVNPNLKPVTYEMTRNNPNTGF